VEKPRYNRWRAVFLGGIVYLIVFQNLVSKVCDEYLGLGKSFGTIFILFLYACFFIIGSIKFLYRGRIFKRYGFLILVFIGVCILLLARVAFDPGSFLEKSLGFINDIFYAFMFVFVYLLFRDTTGLQILVNSLINAGVIAGLIGMIQFFFRGYLPAFFLNPYNEGYFITVGETLYLRPNGLIGNSIIYAHFLLLIGTLLLSRLVLSAESKDFPKFTVVLVAEILVFSRSALVGLVLMLIFIYVFGKKIPHFSYRYLFRIVLGFLVLVIVLMCVPQSRTIVLNKVFNLDVATKMSSILHIEQIKNAVAAIKIHPLSGVGIGTQGPSSMSFGTPIITDGFWFMLPLEIGVPLFALYVLFLMWSYGMSVMIFLKTNSPTLKYVSLAFIGMSTFFYVANFINSAFIGKVNYICYWLLFGIILAYYRAEMVSR